MNEELKTKGELTAEERQYNVENIKPYILPKSTEGLSEEERQRIHEIRVKGGKARGEQMKKAKNLKEIANMLLEAKVSKDKARNILGDMADCIPDEDLTNGALLMARMLNEAYENGTSKSAEFIRDTAGQKPTTEISVTAETMTEADRALMANIAERMGLEKP